jgi:hypothetical protein
MPTRPFHSSVRPRASFARQRPGVFLALAAGAGLLAGRLTRGLAAEAHDGGTSVAAAGTAYARPEEGAPAGVPAVDAGYLPPSGQASATTAWDVPVPGAGASPASAGQDPGAGEDYARPGADVPRAEGTL